MDVEDVRGTLAPYHALLRNELEHHGGTVEKFIGDAVMALFGAPVAHEDDPERAVRAALVDPGCDRAAQRRAAWPGSARAHRYRTPARRSWCWAPTWPAVRAWPRATSSTPPPGFRPRLRSTASWWARPPSTRPIARSPTGQWSRSAQKGSRSRCRCGRHSRPGRGSASTWCSDPRRRWSVAARSSICCLTRCAAAGRSGPPSSSPLVGVPGIGKSRLVWELFEAVEADPDYIIWRQGRSLPYGDGVTFWALGEMVKAQAGILDSDTAREAEDKLRASVAELITDPAEAEWVEEPRPALAGIATEDAERNRSRGRGDHRLAPVSGGAGRPRPAGAGVRGPALGRRRPAGLRRPPGRLGRAACPCWSSAPPGRSCLIGGAAGAAASETRSRSHSRRCRTSTLHT